MGAGYRQSGCRSLSCPSGCRDRVLQLGQDLAEEGVRFRVGDAGHQGRLVRPRYPEGTTKTRDVFGQLF